MEYDVDNLSSNVLGAGISEADLQKVIELSGYPHQSIATDIILKALQGEGRWCDVQEEWPFIDEEEQKVRQLDSFISCHLGERERHPQLDDSPEKRLSYAADVLAECKQSDLPYVFFIRDSFGGDVPQLAGLRYENLTMVLNFDNRDSITARMHVGGIIELLELPINVKPPKAISMSRVQRKGGGKKLELSGEESFRNISLPLNKAVSYFMKARVPSPHHSSRLDIHAVFPIAVLRAPMVGVTVADGQVKTKALPWVRLVRAEPGPDSDQSSRLSAIEVVHIDFLTTYIQLALETLFEIKRRMDTIAMPLIQGVGLWIDREQAADKYGESLPEDAKFYQILKPFMSDASFQEWVAQQAQNSKKQDSQETEGS